MRRPLLLVAGLLTVLGLLLATAGLRTGETVLLPGTASGGVRVVDAAAGELSLAVDVRNRGLLPVRVDGPARDRIGPYAARLGRGAPGGGVPEEESFAPFLLWPGQQRLVVLHLERTGDPAPVRLDELVLDGSVLGLSKDLRVEPPEAVQAR